MNLTNLFLGLISFEKYGIHKGLNNQILVKIKKSPKPISQVDRLVPGVKFQAGQGQHTETSEGRNFFSYSLNIFIWL